MDLTWGMQQNVMHEMMQCKICNDECNKLNKSHNENPETLEGNWSSGLGASQHSTTTRGSRPEI